MRRGNDPSIWRNDAGEIIAFNLGADYCAEHEWGIGGIQSIFGIEQNPKPFSKWWALLSGKSSQEFGMIRRTIKTGEDAVFTFETEIKVERKKVKMYCLTLQKYGEKNPARFEYIFKRVYWMNSSEFIGYWDENSFFIMSPNKKDITELENAFKTKDVAIWVGGGHVFKNGGLIIAIRSRIPEDFSKEAEETDRDSYNLKKAAVSTGIYDILEKAGKGFYALSPRWANAEKTEIQFWLNPEKQNIYNFGWYSIDELQQWAKDEGPVIKKKEEVK